MACLLSPRTLRARCPLTPTAPPPYPPVNASQVQLRDFLVWLTAFICTLFLGVELGLAIAIGLALLIVIAESAFPHTAVLGRVGTGQLVAYRWGLGRGILSRFIMFTSHVDQVWTS